MPAPASAPPRGRLSFLDVARGAAAMLVLAEHGLWVCVPSYLHFSMDHVIIGEAALLVFFLVSGFVIPMSLEGGGSVRGFWVRRCCRLFPVYWFSIALGFATLWLGGPGRMDWITLADTTTWLANLALVQGFLHRPNVWGAFWTLHYELMIYATCSALFACGRLHRVGAKAGWGLVVLFALIGFGRPLLMGEPAGLGKRMMVVVCPVFGLLAYRYVTGRLDRGAFYRPLATLVGTILLALALGYALFPSDVTWQDLLHFVFAWGLGIGGFLALLEVRHCRMPRWACWLGERSYPIYLLHQFVLALVPRQLPPWAFMACLTGGTLLLAALVHRLVERPGITLGRYLERRLRRPAPAPVPAPVEVRRAA